MYCDPNLPIICHHRSQPHTMMQEPNLSHSLTRVHIPHDHSLTRSLVSYSEIQTARCVDGADADATDSTQGKCFYSDTWIGTCPVGTEQRKECGVQGWLGTKVYCCPSRKDKPPPPSTSSPSPASTSINITAIPAPAPRPPAQSPSGSPSPVDAGDASPPSPATTSSASPSPMPSTGRGDKRCPHCNVTLNGASCREDVSFY